MATSHGSHGTASIPVTVVIPAYQRELFVAQAVRSALSQSPRPAEVLVVDDGSSDGTAQAAAAAGATVVRLSTNSGLSAARNAGIEAAAHDWIALLDSDDEWLPGHLDRLWRSREGYVLVSDSYRFSQTGRRGGNVGRQARVLRSPADALWPTNPTAPSCALLARAHVQAVGGFRPVPLAEDLDLWVRLLERGQGLSLPVVGCRYREHDGQLTHGREEGRCAAVESIVAETADRPWNTPALRSRLAIAGGWDVAMTQGRRRRPREAVEALATSIRRPAHLVALGILLGWRLRARATAWPSHSAARHDGTPRAPHREPAGRPEFRAWVTQDLAANSGAPESQMVVLLFRAAQWLDRYGRPRGAARALVKGYRALTYLFLHVELPTQLVIGPGLSIHHPYAIVLNPRVVIGRDVVLRHLVTIGNAGTATDEACPVLGDGVDIGTGAMVLGDITVGDRARIGAGAVVVKDVPAGGVVVGPAASLLRVDPPPAQ